MGGCGRSWVFDCWATERYIWSTLCYSRWTMFDSYWRHRVLYCANHECTHCRGSASRWVDRHCIGSLRWYAPFFLYTHYSTLANALPGISEILPNKYRGMGLAWTELNLASWAIAGTLLADALVSKATWRITFYLTIGYGAFSLIGTALVYFPPSHPRSDGKTKWQEFKELDFFGAFLFISGLAVFLFGLSSGGNTYPWKSAAALAPLILGFIVFLGSFIYDFIFPKDPLFPWYLFKKFREFSSLLALVFVAGMVFFAASALNAQTILYLYTPDAIQIGIYSIPSGYSFPPSLSYSLWNFG